MVKVSLWVAAYLGGFLLLFLYLLLPVEPAEDQVLKKNFVHTLTALQQRAIGQDSVVDLARITTFAWDSLYIFPGVGTVEGISQAIGTSWPGTENVHEEDNLFVFMNHGQLVKYLIFRGFNYQQEPNFIKFTLHANPGQLFTPTTARFWRYRGAYAKPWLELVPLQKQVIYRSQYEHYLQR